MSVPGRIRETVARNHWLTFFLQRVKLITSNQRGCFMTLSLNIERGFYKTLLETYSPDQVKLVKRIVNGEVDNDELFPKTSRWVKSCYNEPTFHEKAFSAIDEVLENHGVEAVRLQNGDWLEYSNTGDTYALTVVFFRGTFRATDYGAIVEKYDR